MAPRPIPQSEIERRIEYLGPLRAYARSIGAKSGVLMAIAARRAKAAGLPMNTSGKVWPEKMALGLCVVPPWLVEQCCMVLGLPVVTVMGAEWVKRYGVDGRGGEEDAPVSAPHIKHFKHRRVYVADNEYDEAGEGDDHAA